MVEYEKDNLPERILYNGDMPKINQGQEALFLLVCEAVREKRIIQQKETEYIYRMCVQQSETTGQYMWSEANKKWEWCSRKKNDWEFQNCYYAWLLRALGALIKKGYLTVIPRMELNSQKELSEK